MLTVVAPFAVAQEPDLSVALTDGVRCSAAAAKQDIEGNIRKLTSPPEAITSALNLVAADGQRCAPIRDAAAELAVNPIVALAPDPKQQAAAQAQAIVAQTLADANNRAAQLKFDVGPPPRNMTNGKSVGP